MNQEPLPLEFSDDHAAQRAGRHAGARRQPDGPVRRTARATIDCESLHALPPVVDLMTAARLLGIGRTKAYELVRSDRWPTRVLHLDRRYRIPRADLLALLGEQRIGA